MLSISRSFDNRQMYRYRFRSCRFSVAKYEGTHRSLNISIFENPLADKMLLVSLLLVVISFSDSFRSPLFKIKSARTTSLKLQSDQIDDASYEVKFDNGFLESLKKKRSYPSILIERFMQTIDDIQVSQKVKNTSVLNKSIIREKLVVLGSGWGAYSFLKTIDPTMYDITVISPRNYFTFTPMLAASAVGTVEFRSICEPIRNISPYIQFIESTALSINHITKDISCQSVKCSGMLMYTA